MKRFIRFVSGVMASILLLGGMSIRAAEVRYTLNDTSYFRDAALVSYLKANFDTNGDNYLSASEVSAVRTIDISGRTDVVYIKQLSIFTNVTTLNISNNKVSGGDLKTLLTSSFGRQLQQLLCYNCGLTFLELSNCPNLRTLKCQENNIRIIDVQANPHLLDMCEVDDQLHVSRSIHYYEDGRYQLRYDAGVQIEIAPYSDYFGDYGLYMLALDNLGLSNWDFTNVTPDFLRRVNEVTSIDTASSPNITLNIGSLRGLDMFTNLETLNLPGQKFTSADLSSFTSLKTVNLNGNTNLTSLTLGNNPIETLYAENCNLSSIDVSGLTNLKHLFLTGNSGLTSLNISNNAALSYLKLTDTGITQLDISNNPNLVMGVKPSNRELFGYALQYAKYNVAVGQNVCYLEVNKDVTIVTPTPTPVTKSGWVDEDGNWYYYVSNQKVTGWQIIGEKWYFFDANGVMLTGWQAIGGKWYYFKSSGAMVTGWKQIGDKWYYFKSSGAMVTGWNLIGGSWYYFKSSGAMVTDWQKIDGKWYYFKSSGAMVTGWQAIGGKWYYFESSGAMVTGWKKINSKQYYFYSSGAMASNTWIDNKYYVDSTGAWTQTR